MKNSRQEAVLTAILMAAGLLPFSAKADISFPKYGEELIYTLHTHLTSPSSGLPSQTREYKVAKVCFIIDTDNNCVDGQFSNNEQTNTSPSGGNHYRDDDYKLDDAERCRKEGYTLTSCTAGEIPDGYCIYDNKYFSKCTCPSGFKTCEPPYYGVGDACGDKYLYCEKNTERACKELNSEYTQTCQSGWKIDPNNACEYDETFGKCCNLCEGYDYTSIPEGYIADGDACVDCNGTKKYKIKINPCDGFQDCGTLGGEVGATTCQSGDVIKYSACVPCENKGTLTSCPTGANCTKEECSNLYYITSCKTNYTLTNGTCVSKCAGYYSCGGSWQLCEGRTCPTDSSLCSTYCESDHFPYSCSSPSLCYGDYRSGYCSVECDDSSSSSGSSGSSGGDCPPGTTCIYVNPTPEA